MVCSTARVPWRRLVTGRGNGAERTYVDIDTFTATFGTAHACGTETVRAHRGIYPRLWATNTGVGCIQRGRRGQEGTPANHRC